ncbi:MAG: DUF4290 domain-containing protein [Bacteroidetes bacterium]|nr:MAG: DUF4290 domain-containing protein [Bacteroidota bacterium]
MKKDIVKDYNTQKDYLVLKEYGRNVQKLVQYISSIESIEERTRAAHSLIALMRQLNPSVREQNDNIQRIWDHLFHMADFKLEINCPYPVPDRESLYPKPMRLRYNNKPPMFRHYGKNVECMIEKASQITEPEDRLMAIQQTLRLMKAFYSTWNRENIEDDVIQNDLLALSKGRLQMSEIAEATNQGENRQNNQNRYQQNRNDRNDRSGDRGGDRNSNNPHKRRFQNNNNRDRRIK